MSILLSISKESAPVIRLSPRQAREFCNIMNGLFVKSEDGKLSRPSGDIYRDNMQLVATRTDSGSLLWEWEGIEPGKECPDWEWT